jgi:hypothetical protein
MNKFCNRIINLDKGNTIKNEQLKDYLILTSFSL